jgi:hypothetical protein
VFRARNDNSGGQAGFLIQRATGTTGTFASIAQTAAGVTSYTDAGLSFGMTDSAGTSSFSNLACASPSGGFTLAAAKTRTGVGIVASTPTGIDCGTACSYTYNAGTAVTVAPTPASGSAFSGWVSGGCSGTDPCTLVGNGSVTVTAAFATVPTYTLTVSKQGPGTVSSSPAGINCGSLCWAACLGRTSVTLTAVPAKGARFNGWNGGGCTGTAICTVTLNTAMSVTASFSKGGKK